MLFFTASFCIFFISSFVLSFIIYFSFVLRFTQGSSHNSVAYSCFPPSLYTCLSILLSCFQFLLRLLSGRLQGLATSVLHILYYISRMTLAIIICPYRKTSLMDQLSISYLMPRINYILSPSTCRYICYHTSLYEVRVKNSISYTCYHTRR